MYVVWGHIRLLLIDTKTALCAVFLLYKGLKMRFIVNLILLTSLFPTIFSYETAGTDSTLDVITWNIENFPMGGDDTVAEVEVILAALNADLIGVQEIRDTLAFDEMIQAIDTLGYTLSPHRFSSGSYSKVGYIYNNAKLTLLNSEMLFSDEGYYFPRPPYRAEFSYAENGNSTTFEVINLHLKAQGDATSVERRRVAMTMLKTYLDAELEGDRRFIVLGDYNDEVDDDEVDIFEPFLNNPQDYIILTQPLQGVDYSYYPAFFSLIDHLMITSNLEDIYGESGATMVLHLDEQDTDYEPLVSDHRPVYSRFAFDNVTTDPYISIDEIQQNFADYEGLTVLVKGVITVPAGALSSSFTSAFIQDTTGYGINLYRSGNVYTDFLLGSEVSVSGTVLDFNGLHEIVIDSYNILSTGNALPAYQPISTQNIQDISLQGALYRCNGIVTAISGRTLQVNDGSGDGKVYIDSDTGIEYENIAVGDTVNVRGILSVYQNESQLQPIFHKDLEKVSFLSINAPKVASGFRLLSNYPNPFNPSTTVSFLVSQPGLFEFKIYNSSGLWVNTLSYRVSAPGSYDLQWDGTDHHNRQTASGVYFLTVQGQALKLMKIK
jgi:exonuclease III